MAIRLSMSEILAELTKFKSKAQKVEWLRQNDSVPFRQVLRCIYDSDIEFLLPDSAPPWKFNEFEDEAKPLLFREARRLRIFIKGGGYDHLNQIKREALFIQLLQDLDNDDAKLLAHNMLPHKSVKGLTRKTLEEAYPDLFDEPLKLA